MTPSVSLYNPYSNLQLGSRGPPLLKDEQRQYIVIHDVPPFLLLRGTLTPTKYSLLHLHGVHFCLPFLFTLDNKKVCISKINK